MEFIFVQSLGFMGWLFHMMSYWNKEINKVLLFQVISGIFYIVHYLLLGADVGIYIILFDIVRDFAYYKTNIDKYLFVISLPFYFALSYFLYDGFLSLFPLFASVNDGYSLAYKDKEPVLGAMLSCLLWIFYDYIAGSYICVITGIIMLISDIIVFIKNKTNKKAIA